MAESQATPEITNIFALDGSESFADTSVEEWNSLRPMLDELKRLKRLVRGMPSDACMNRDQLNALYRKYPLLEYAGQEPAPGNPFMELRARVTIWREAYAHLGYILSDAERQVPDAFWELMRDDTVGEYKFIWPRALGKIDTAPYDIYVPECASIAEIDNPRPMRVGTHFRHLALDDLWTFSQTLRRKPQLTPAQAQDVQKLEHWIAAQIKELLIDEECGFERAVNAGWNDTQIVIARFVAVQIVEARIADGDWQTPGAPCLFNFNGLED